MNAWYNEIDPQKAAWLRELIQRGVIASGVVDERSIADVRSDELRGYSQCHFFAGIGIWSYALRLAEWPDNREVWTGSCPCQPFSAAGKGAAFNDERHLWPEFFRLIEARRPVVCFGEQVASIDGLAWLDLVQSDLDGAGYTCGAVDLCAAGFGAPHRRQRLYWVADRAGEGLEGSSGQIIQARGHRLASSSSSSSSMVNFGSNNQPSSDSATCRLDNSYVDRAERCWTSERVISAGCEVDKLADSVHGRYAGRRIDNDGRTEDARRDSTERSEYRERPETRSVDGVLAPRGPVNGFWSGADWVLTRPQRVGNHLGLRPVERGSFPLAHGATARMGRLRGYGDGIVAEVAKGFIEAYLDITDERQTQ